MNTAILTGNLASDVKLTPRRQGGFLATFLMITNEQFPDDNGHIRKIDTRHFVKVWVPEAAARLEGNLGKGDRVAVAGAIQVSRRDKDGVRSYDQSIDVRIPDHFVAKIL